MKFAGMIIAAAVAPAVVADFWLNYILRITVKDDNIYRGVGGAFVNDPRINCQSGDIALRIWDNSADVSHDEGMRTVPGDDVGKPLFRDPLEIVEFNTLDAKPGHHTIYQDRGYGMYDVHNKKTGQCYLNRTYTYDLSCRKDGAKYVLRGSSMFFCESDIQL
ncbi:hypothetical protein GGR54DRAFT_654015 [Hypoxylon sp. NC1633]|nr:hypothetical protein GGR54DRAFT_654015 [Hypoxylon sp. NC1633]